MYYVAELRAAWAEMLCRPEEEVVVRVTPCKTLLLIQEQVMICQKATRTGWKTIKVKMGVRSPGSVRRK